MVVSRGFTALEERPWSPVVVAKWTPVQKFIYGGLHNVNDNS